MKTCSYDGCRIPVFAKGYCKYHQYLRTDKKPILKTSKPLSNKKQKKSN